MIVEVVKKPIPRYGRYFLSQEAPGDEGQDIDSAPKSNTRVIDIKPSGYRMNFADGADTEDMEDLGMDGENMIPPDGGDTMIPPEDTSTNNEFDTMIPPDNTPSIPDVTPTDQTMIPPEGDANISIPPDTPVPGEPVATPLPEADTYNPDNDQLLQDTQATTNDINGADQVMFAPDNGTGEETIPPDGGDGTIPPDTTGGDPNAIPPDGAAPIDDGTGPDTSGGPETADGDFSAGADSLEDDGSAAGDTGGETSDAGAGEKKGPGLEYDSMRKYNLFKNFLSLVNALDNYVEKLESTMNDDYDYNKITKIVIDKLRDIRELTYDYIIMKFEISSYIQALLYYQNQVIMVQCAFDLLDKGKKTLQKRENKK